MGPTWQPPPCKDCALATTCRIKQAAVQFWIAWHYCGLTLTFDRCIEQLPKERVRYGP